MTPRHLIALAVAGALLVIAVAAWGDDREVHPAAAGKPAAKPSPPVRPKVPARRGTKAYRGAGAWVDQYDGDILDGPSPALQEMHAHGVRTVFLETGSWRLPEERDFRDRDGDELIVDQAHALGMKVVAWYLPGLDDVPLDMRRTRAALDMRTERGGRFDGFAADIESQRVRSLRARNAALMRYSRALRRAAGAKYALGAIVPDQRSSTVARGIWPGLPYRAIARVYDVFLPMAYSTVRGHGAAFTYRYTRANVEYLRRATGGRPVHLIGGIDPGLLPSEPAAIVRGARSAGSIGVSFYDFAGAQDATWRALRSAP